MLRKIIKRYSLRKLFIFIGDFIFLVIAVLISLSFEREPNEIVFVNPISSIQLLSLYFVIILITLITFRYINLYKEKIYLTYGQQLVGIIKSLSLSGILLIVFTFFIKVEALYDNSRLHLILFLFFGIILISFYRLILLKFFRNSGKSGIFKRRVLAIGAGEAGIKFAARIKELDSNIKLLGFIDQDENKVGTRIDDIKVLGTLDNLNVIAESLKIDEILITIKAISYDKIMNIIEVAKLAKCQINLLAPHFGVIEKKFAARDHKDIISVPIYTTISPFYTDYIKRIIDVVFTVLGLILISPLFLIFAILIKLTSKGPVFYKTEVVGKDGKKFVWYKFRTMLYENNTDVHREHLKKIITENRSVEKIKKDERITSIGNFLRKYSLDEMPQLFNVLIGDMTLIGPRPCLPYEYEWMDYWHKRRFKVTPGLSGLWQIIGRNKSDVSFNDSLVMDLYYVDNISFWLDLKIFLKTIPVVVLGRGGK
jgi:exopolysaccharide biosynthesis polyprenyl glycosylphosphotransferase